MLKQSSKHVHNYLYITMIKRSKINSIAIKVIRKLIINTFFNK